MREHNVDFALLRRVIPLTSILDRYGLLRTLTRAGQQLRGPCPLHGGRNKRAFVVDPEESTWRCFGECDRGGGTFEFVAAHEGCSVIDAAQKIAQWFAIAPKASPKPERRTTVSGGKPSHKVFAVEDRKGAADDDPKIWTRIGSAWPHKKGFNIQLTALPLNGRIVLIDYEDEDAEEDEKQTKSRSARR